MVLRRLCVTGLLDLNAHANRAYDLKDYNSFRKNVLVKKLGVKKRNIKRRRREGGGSRGGVEKEEEEEEQQQTAAPEPPRWPSGKASASRAEDPGFESPLATGFFRGRVIPVT